MKIYEGLGGGGEGRNIFRLHIAEYYNTRLLLRFGKLIGWTICTSLDHHVPLNPDFYIDTRYALCINFFLHVSVTMLLFPA